MRDDNNRSVVGGIDDGAESILRQNGWSVPGFTDFVTAYGTFRHDRWEGDSDMKTLTPHSSQQAQIVARSPKIGLG